MLNKRRDGFLAVVCGCGRVVDKWSGMNVYLRYNPLTFKGAEEASLTPRLSPSADYLLCVLKKQQQQQEEGDDEKWDKE